MLRRSCCQSEGRRERGAGLVQPLPAVAQVTGLRDAFNPAASFVRSGNLGRVAVVLGNERRPSAKEQGGGGGEGDGQNGGGRNTKGRSPNDTPPHDCQRSNRRPNSLKTRAEQTTLSPLTLRGFTGLSEPSLPPSLPTFVM